MIVEGKSVAETARETHHSPEAITRYVKDYKQILACLHKGLTLKETSFVVKVSEKLVFEYVKRPAHVNGTAWHKATKPSIKEHLGNFINSKLVPKIQLQVDLFIC